MSTLDVGTKKLQVGTRDLVYGSARSDPTQAGEGNDVISHIVGEVRYRNGEVARLWTGPGDLTIPGTPDELVSGETGWYLDRQGSLSSLPNIADTTLITGATRDPVTGHELYVARSESRFWYNETEHQFAPTRPAWLAADAGLYLGTGVQILQEGTMVAICIAGARRVSSSTQTVDGYTYDRARVCIYLRRLREPPTGVTKGTGMPVNVGDEIVTRPFPGGDKAALYWYSPFYACLNRDIAAYTSLETAPEAPAEPPETPFVARFAGRPAVGSTLTAGAVYTAGGVTGVTLSRQWYRADEHGLQPAEITGETGDTYTLTADDEGHRLFVRVAAFTDAGGNEIPELDSTFSPVIVGSGFHASLRVFLYSIHLGFEGENTGVFFPAYYGFMLTPEALTDGPADDDYLPYDVTQVRRVFGAPSYSRRSLFTAIGDDGLRSYWLRTNGTIEDRSSFADLLFSPSPTRPGLVEIHTRPDANIHRSVAGVPDGIRDRFRGLLVTATEIAVPTRTGQRQLVFQIGRQYRSVPPALISIAPFRSSNRPDDRRRMKVTMALPGDLGPEALEDPGLVRVTLGGIWSADEGVTWHKLGRDFHGVLSGPGVERGPDGAMVYVAEIATLDSDVRRQKVRNWTHADQQEVFEGDNFFLNENLYADGVNLVLWPPPKPPVLVPA